MQGHHDHAEAGDDTPSHQSAAIDEDEIRAIYQFIYRYVGNREDAENLTKRACIQALRKTRDVPGARSLEETLWQAAESVVTEHLRWFYGSDDAVGADILAGEHTNTPTQIRCMLEQLPRREQDFLTRRFLDNTSLAETAATLHLPLRDAQALQWHALARAALLARAARQEESCTPL